MDKPGNYYQGINQSLLHHVPETAVRILEIGCATGVFGAALKELNPKRYVVGVEYVPEVAEVARTHLDEVYAFDIQTHEFPDSIELQSFDCIVCGDVLEHLTEATSVLRKLLRYLKPDGKVVACIPNVQHFSVIQQLLTQNFQYHGVGLLDKTHVNLMTLPNMFKMFLDAGYFPQLAQVLRVGAVDEGFMHSLLPVLGYLGVAPERAKSALEAYQYVLTASIQQANINRAETWASEIKPQACTVAVAMNNPLQYQNNVAASPELASNDMGHQLLPMTGAQNMAQAWEHAKLHAAHDWIVLVHQDVYLPTDWLKQVQYAWHEAEAELGQQIGVLGVVGMRNLGDETVSYLGRCIDRVATYLPAASLPSLTDSLDELVLVYRKDRFLPVMSPELGFHFYGTDSVLKAQEAGLAAAVVDVPCFHNSSRFGSHMDDEDLKQKAMAFHQLWQHRLPVFTLVAQMRPDKIVLNAS